MDVEEDDYSLISLFDVSPAAFPWPADVIHGIEQRRAAMADVLIFDILLTLGGVKHPDALYPPRDADVLQRLLTAIEDSSYDALKKDGLIYFLLKWHLDGRETYYAQSRCIPPQFVALADAYWCLDSGENVARAVSLLADARLNRDYTSKILQAISLDSNAHQLILRYVRTAKPLLTEPDDIDAYSIALAESSLLEAWKHQRTYAEGGATRDRLLRNIFTWCLTPKPRSKPLTQLVAFPLNAYEQSQLHAYALHPPRALPTSAASVIQDLAFMRLVQSGQHAAAIKLNHQLAAVNARSKDRKQTMEELMAVMPPAERQLLEAEIERMSPTGDAGTRFLTNGISGASAGPSTGTGELSMSWESVRSPKKQPTALTPQKETPQKPSQQQQQPQRQQKGNPVPPSPAPLFESAVPPIPHRSGAPRFGGQSPASASVSASGASSSFTAVREMFDAMARQSPRQPAGSLFAVGSPASASASVSATLAGQPASGRGAGQSISAGAGPSAGASASSTPRKRGRVSGNASASLFETAGSANQTGNAFFQPAPKSISRSAANTTPGSVLAGTKRPLEAISSPQSAGASARRAKRGDVAVSAGAGAGNGSMSMSISAPGTRRGQAVEEEEEDADADVEMHDSEAEVDAEGEAEETGEGDLTFPHIEVVVDAASDHGLSEDEGEEEGHSEIEAQAGAETEVEELSYSLFAPPADSARDGLERGETRKSTSPPGAFLAPEEENEREQEHEQEHEHERVDVEHERAAKGKGKEKQYDDEYEEEYEHRPQRDAMRVEELTTTNKASAARTPPRRRESRIPRTQPQARQKQEPKAEQSTRKQPARLTRTRSAQMEAQLMRSIPGAFLDVDDIPEEREEHSHEDEESDVAPPRPSTPSTGPSTRTRRARPEREKTRTRAEATAKTPSRPRRASRGAEVPRTGTRRSTRLAESESSDEQRPTRSRKSTKSGGSTGTDKGTKTPGRATRASARKR